MTKDGLNTEGGEGTELEFLEGTGKGDENKKKLSMGGGGGEVVHCIKSRKLWTIAQTLISENYLPVSFYVSL